MYVCMYVRMFRSWGESEHERARTNHVYIKHIFIRVRIYIKTPLNGNQPSVPHIVLLSAKKENCIATPAATPCHATPTKFVSIQNSLFTI